jgi:hypothetical protein
VLIDNKWVFFDSREERKQYVIGLYKEGRSVRDIAQEIRMFFSDIGAIIRKVTGITGQKKRKLHYLPRTQKHSNYFEGKKPIHVAIALNLGSKEVDRLYREYWHLQCLLQIKSSI